MGDAENLHKSSYCCPVAKPACMYRAAYLEQIFYTFSLQDRLDNKIIGILDYNMHIKLHRKFKITESADLIPERPVLCRNGRKFRQELATLCYSNEVPQFYLQVSFIGERYS